MAGYLSDRIGASAIVASVFVYLTIPVLYMYRTYGEGPQRPAETPLLLPPCFP